MNGVVDSASRRPQTRPFGACLSNKHSASGAVVILEKGGGQLSLEDASSDDIRYLVGGVR